MRRHIAALFSVASFLAGASPALADVVYDERGGNDISGDRFNPTLLTLQEGDNTLIGIMTGLDDLGFPDRDYFRFTVPVGYTLSAIRLDAYVSTDFAAFFGVQPGVIFPNDPDTVQPGDLMGWCLFGPQDQGLDLLPIMGSNGIGFTPPLPAGNYAFWGQQIGAYTEYLMNFEISPVPSPGAASMLGLGAAFTLRRRRSR